jgi:hypothetical protein
MVSDTFKYTPDNFQNSRMTGKQTYYLDKLIMSVCTYL